MARMLSEYYEISEGDTRSAKIDYRKDLDSGELLTGTPTVVEQDTSDLTISNVAVSTTTETVKGETVAIGQAVVWTVTGGLESNSPYLIRVTTSTDASPAQTFAYDLRLSWNG